MTDKKTEMTMIINTHVGHNIQFCSLMNTKAAFIQLVKIWKTVLMISEEELAQYIKERYFETLPAPTLRHWTPIACTCGIPLNILNLRHQMTLPPLPHAIRCSHINPVSALPSLPPNNASITFPDIKNKIVTQLTNPLIYTSAIKPATGQRKILNFKASNSPDSGVGETEAGSSSSAESEAFGSLATDVDITTLLDKLVAAGMISILAVKEKQIPELEEKKEIADDETETSKDDKSLKKKFNSLIGFSSESLRRRNPALICSLYSGGQCATCGMRFKKTK